MRRKNSDLLFFSPLSEEEGIVMPVALMIMLLLTGLGLGALSNSSLDLLTMRSQKHLLSAKESRCRVANRRSQFQQVVLSAP